jgi:hypothetical protein
MNGAHEMSSIAISDTTRAELIEIGNNNGLAAILEVIAELFNDFGEVAGETNYLTFEDAKQADIIKHLYDSQAAKISALIPELRDLDKYIVA